jgi:ankyrin repeat protein
LITTLLDLGADINYIDPDFQFSAFHRLSATPCLQSFNTLQYILNNHRDKVNLETKCPFYHDATPLLLAACLSPDEYVELFLHHGADVTAKSSSGAHFIQCIAQSKTTQLLPILLNRYEGQFAIDNCDIYGRTPLLSAILNLRLDFVQVLLQDHNANINDRDNRNRSVIHHAIPLSRMCDIDNGDEMSEFKLLID